MKTILKQTAIYMIITFAVTVAAALLQQKLYQIFNIDFLNFKRLEGAPIILPQLAPAISFFIIALIIRKLRFSINYAFSKTIAFRSLIALCIPLILASIIFSICKLLGITPEITCGSLSVIIFAISSIAIGALGEEIGWRGFLQPLLEKQVSPLSASVLVGLLWGLWHVGHFANGALFMTSFLVFTVSASITAAWLYRETKFCITIPVLIHTSINSCFFIFFKSLLADERLMAITAVVWMIPAISIFLLTGKQLQRSQKD